MTRANFYLEDTESGAKAFVGDTIKYEAVHKGGWGSSTGTNTMKIVGFRINGDIIFEGALYMPCSGIAGFKVVKRA